MGVGGSACSPSFGTAHPAFTALPLAARSSHLASHLDSESASFPLSCLPLTCPGWLAAPQADLFLRNPLWGHVWLPPAALVQAGPLCGSLPQLCLLPGEPLPCLLFIPTCHSPTCCPCLPPLMPHTVRASWHVTAQRPRLGSFCFSDLPEQPHGPAVGPIGSCQPSPGPGSTWAPE